MRRTSVTYAMFFNKRYHHSGSVFQGKYKNILVDNSTYLVHLSRYIHQNPLGIPNPSSKLVIKITNLKDYKYSSYNNYLKPKTNDWIYTLPILTSFSNTSRHHYQAFVETQDSNDTDILGDQIIETH